MVYSRRMNDTTLDSDSAPAQAPAPDAAPGAEAPAPAAPEAPARRTIALVGRPNVGKSALFNRIARQRIAIVYEEAGVTRDRLEREVERDGRRFMLADTGGIFALDGERVADRIDAGVRAQALAALEGAAAVVLVVDVQAGLQPMDIEVARLLRKAGAEAFVAANKADNDALEAHADEFSRLGFPVFPVSALHGRGVAALLEACYSRLPAETPEPFGAGPDDRREETTVAVVGRPNCGKSSFLNRLLRAERVIVSDVPGTTRDPIDIPFEYAGRRYTLVDTAGVRREARVDSAVERYSRFRMQDALDRADLLVLMLDCERGAGLLDRQLAGLVAKQGKSCVIAVNKWDLARESERDYAARLARELPFMAHCPVVFLSAKTGRNVGLLLSTVARVAAAARTTLPTGPLNRCLQAACRSNAAPTGGARPLRLHYAAQTGTNPVRVRLFVNDPRRMPASFEQFLANTIRREFGLGGVGVLLQFRGRERTNPDGTPKPEAPRDLRELRAARKASGKSRARRRAMPRG